MGEQLTRSDVKKIEEEIQYRKLVVRKDAIEAVKEARAQGDLSENFEYYAAKKDKNANESRIRYLERMIRTAKVISTQSQEDTVGLFDRVTVYHEKMNKEMVLCIVTTLRQDVLKGRISKESPVGKALLGHKVGDRVEVVVSPEMHYGLVIRSIEKGEDTGEIPLNRY